MRRIIEVLLNLRWKYLFYRSIVIVDRSSKFTVGKHCKIARSKIVVKNGNSVAISDYCRIDNCVISSIELNNWGRCAMTVGHNTEMKNVTMLVSGNVFIGAHNEINNVDEYLPLTMWVGGELSIGDHNRISSKIWIRFGGQLMIGNYNCVNERSEIRADESVYIGSYNMISYDCCIWDTNTHCMYPKEERRAMTEDPNLYIGYEKEKPVTRPVVIGDDNWIGRYCTIMKGCEIGNECVLAFHTLLINQKLPDSTMAYNKVETKVTLK